MNLSSSTKRDIVTWAKEQLAVACAIHVYPPPSWCDQMKNKEDIVAYKEDALLSAVQQSPFASLSFWLPNNRTRDWHQEPHSSPSSEKSPRCILPPRHIIQRRTMFIKYLTPIALILPIACVAERVQPRFNQVEFLRVQFGGSNQQLFSPPSDNDGIHLAVSPQCGQLSGTQANINAGIDRRNIRTIVSFGVGLKLILEKHCWISHRTVTLTEGSPMVLDLIHLS